MKKIITAVVLAIGTVLFSCQETVDLSQINNFPPTVFSTSPDGATKIGSAFDIKVVLVDGPSSPLASATITLTDSAGTKTLATVTQPVAGVKDSVILTASSFKASTLPLGQYNIVVKAVDTKGNETDKTIPFKVSTNLYAAKNKAMYLAGVFDNWGAEPFTLTAAYTWTIKNIDLKGGQFKFKNTVDWTDADWGDPTCSGVMKLKSDNVSCKYTGLVNITFYDNTLKYSVTPAVNFARNVNNLYFVGSVNSFEGSDYAFTLTADHIWTLDEVRIKPGDQYKFSSGPYSGSAYGDSGTPNVAAADAKNFTSTAVDAYYKVVFNDKSLAYTTTLVRYPYPAKLYLVGAVVGWDATKAVAFASPSTGKFVAYAHLKHGDGFKFLPTNVNFDGDYGAQKGTTNVIAQDNEDNADVATDGYYLITVDFNTQSFSTTPATWGLIGDATPPGWDHDVDLTPNGDKWSIDVDLAATGALKFRFADAWDVNMGGSNGKLSYGGDNIATPGAGNYHIEITLDPINGYTYTLTKN